MSKKDLAAVTTDLSALAAVMPTQRPTSPMRVVAEQPTLSAPPRRGEEPISQFSFGLRKELRKQLSRLADDADMTMRAFVLSALKEKGLDVRDDDLADLRKSGAH